MKKALPVLVALYMSVVLAAVCGAPHAKADASGEGLKIADPIQGIYQKPADAPQASCVIRYSLPQFESNEAVNQYYQSFAGQLDSVITQDCDGEIRYELAYQSERYLSVLITVSQEAAQGAAEHIIGHTFACDGLYAGQVLTLSQLLGMEQETAADQTLAAELVYELVWQIVEYSAANVEGDYLDGLTKEDLQAAFDPETDFYLNADGNVVFYVQSGEIAGEIAGTLYYPFAPAELLSTI